MKMKENEFDVLMFEAKRKSVEKDVIKKRAVKHKRILWWRKTLSLMSCTKT
tara:strand:- start:899 stop:1051 length:153 start_codon:yes stop_codon:yes gene_type:complete